ncbi:MAG: YhdP family protein, partial [Gammaproteobacteria bacterium]
MRIKLIARFVFRRILYIAIVLVIAAAVLVGSARALTPVLNKYRDQIAYFASQTLHLPVSINNVSGTWHWLQPMIKLHDVQINQPDSTMPLLQIQELDIGIDLFKSLLHWHVEPGTILIKGSSVEFIQQANHSWQLQGMVSHTKSQIKSISIFNWLLNRDRIGLKNINITVVPQHYPLLHLSNINLDLLSFGNRHLLEGEMELTQHTTIPIEISAHTYGAINNFKKFKNHFHVVLQNIVLNDWLSDIVMKKYTVTGTINTLDLHGVMRGLIVKKLIADVAGNHINITNNETKKSIPIDHITADTQLAHLKPQQWQLILHRWQLQYHGLMLPENSGEIDLNYNNKTDYDLILALNHIILSDLQPLWHLQNTDIQKVGHIMTIMQPRGELQQVQIHVMQKPNVDLNYALQVNLNNVSWLPWNEIPGLTHLSGNVKLDQAQGAATLSGQNSIITMPLVFRQPANLNAWNSEVNWHKQNNGWLLQSGNTSFSVQQGQANNQLSLFMPANGNSPDIDLTSQVDIKQLTQQDIYQYLPVGILSNTVVSWLDQNVLSLGETHATLTFKGALSHFPYDHHDGTFLITVPFQGAAVQLSPGWPVAEDIAGNMRFAGRSMDIQVSNGSLSGMHILPTRVQIPYMGVAQAVNLHIDGQAQGDASQALQFLHHSPLQQYLQQGLSTATAQGPITVNLGLTIPLAQTGNAQPVVNGRVQLKGVATRFPDWGIALNALQGVMQFGHSGLAANKITGQLMGLPLTINIVPPSKQNKQQLQI